VNFPPVPGFSIDTHDPVAQDIYISGSVHSGNEPWDGFVWRKLVSLLQHRETGHTPLFVDVGANLGYFSLAAASMGAHVIAFEPMSRNARKFSKSILKNQFEGRITLYQNAVWEEGSVFPLSMHATSTSNQGNGQVRSQGSGAELGQGVYGVDYVNGVSLSYVVREDVDVLKIDVEGSEGVVIAGAKRLICDFSVKYILMEFTEVKQRTDQYSAVEMLRFLDSAGYFVSDVTPGASPLSIADYINFPPNILFTLKGSRAVCV
jgi:FkbM family methyltransferase